MLDPIAKRLADLPTLTRVALCDPGKQLFSSSSTQKLRRGRTYVGKVFGCALLAPDIIESILEGRQPKN